MVSINYATREVTCKIVYYGPGLSGKTTNLIYVHKKVPPTTRGKLISLATEADRTLYFDFLPINIGAINGFAAKFQLYTVPGQVYYNATRKLVLRGTDGLVFVADSQAEKMDENIESLTNLKENLEEYGYDLKEIPIVIQYNKRDLPGILSVAELDAKLNPLGWKSFGAEAVSGKGVFDTLKMIIKLVLEKAKTSRSTSSPARESAPVAERAAEEGAVGPAAAAYAASPTASGPIIEPSPASAGEPPQVRQPVYEAGKNEPVDEDVETSNEESVEYNTLDEERMAQSVGHPDGLSEPSPSDDVTSVEQTIPVSPEEKSQRPYPGSTTSRILRRERRITVSDFQPAAREEESMGFKSRMSAEDKRFDMVNTPDLPTPSMAPSQRLIRKKPGFFKRLFGIK